MQPLSIFWKPSCWMLKCGYGSLRAECFRINFWYINEIHFTWGHGDRRTYGSNKNILYSKYYFIFSVHILQEGVIMSVLTFWFMINDIKPVFCRDLSSVVKELILIIDFSNTERPPSSCNWTRTLIICSVELLEAMRQITSAVMVC